jgi:ketosteroid isomerase-like protein
MSDRRQPVLRVIALAASLALTGCASIPAGSLAAREVEATELAFARTMASRDFAAFAGFIADDAIFHASDGPLRGKAAVLAHWQRYFAAPAAPFSWRPGRVEVLAEDGLAMSRGPVFDPAGRCVAGFTSIWRRRDDGHWQIIFDKGEDECPEQ